MTALVIARNTFREAIRDRVLAGVAGAGLVLLALTQLAGTLALGEGLRLTVDLGLSGISLLGLLVVLLVGTSLVAKEIERRTVYGLLSRPIPRHVYLLGKWLGLAAALWVLAAGLGAALWALVALKGHAGYAASLVEAVGLAGLELTVVTSIAVLFSALSTPVLSALYTLGLTLAGQWCDDLRRFAQHFPGVLRGTMEFVANLMPNLTLFNMRSLAASGTTTSALHLALALAYAAVYCGCMLALASAAFETRDFK